MKSTIEVHGVGVSTDLDCFHRSPLPEASCCPVNSCSFPVDVVVGCVGVYGYSVRLISLLHCLLVFTNSNLQCSLGFPNVYLRAVLARNLVDHFLLLLFRHLLLHSHKLLLQCTLGLEDSFHSKGSTGLLNLLTETSHIGGVECLQWLLFCFMRLLSLRFGEGLSDQLLREPIGFKHSGKVFHLWLPAGAVTDMEGSVTHTSHHSCQHSGMVVRRYGMYNSVWVGFLYTAVDSWSLLQVTRTSRNASLPSFSFSIVNWMLVDIWLKCAWKDSMSHSPWGQMTKVLST